MLRCLTFLAFLACAHAIVRSDSANANSRLRTAVAALRERSQEKEAILPVFGKEEFKCEEHEGTNFTTLCDEYFVKVREAFKVGEFEEGKNFKSIDEFFLSHGDRLKFSSGEAGAGKSGAKFFFFGPYMVKTLKDAELELLESSVGKSTEPLAADMTDYLEDEQNQTPSKWGTTMSRYYGLIKDKAGKRWLLQNNLFFDPVRESKGKFPTKFDIKGSSLGREATPGELRDGDLKDKEWNEWHKNFYIPKDSAQRLLNTLRLDSEFLARHDLIDYSVLMGVNAFKLEPCYDGKCTLPYCFREDRGTCVDLGSKYVADYLWQVGDRSCGHEPREDDNCFTSLGEQYNDATGRYNYTLTYACLGTIDLLTKFTSKKRAEWVVKGGFIRDSSVQHPDVYQKRFIQAMEDTLPDVDPKVTVTPFTVPPKHCCRFPHAKAFEPHCDKDDAFKLPPPTGTHNMWVLSLGGIAVVGLAVFIGREILFWYRVNPPTSEP